MTLEQFNLTWNGEYNLFPTNPKECVCIIKQYFQDVLNVPVFHGNAIDYWNHTPPGFKKIPKTIFNQPEPGDIIIWDTTVNKDGHIALVNWARFFDFGGFEQNFPEGTPCHFQDHPNYKNVLGWIHPIPTKFVMEYTAFNADPDVLESARKLLGQYSGGKLDCRFAFKFIDPIVLGTLWDTDAQISFLRKNTVRTPFTYLTYHGNDPGHLDQVTQSAPGYTTILTASFPGVSPIDLCYEFTNAIYKYFQDRNIAVSNDDPEYPTPENIIAKLNTIAPTVDKFLQNL